VDTATCYRNEEAIGAALRECGLPPEEVYLTTKVAPAELGRTETRDAVERSVERLGRAPSLVLIHWPGAAKQPPSSPLNRDRRRGAWEALEECLASGLIGAIGVSNYEVSHLEELLAHCRVRPLVNQFEVHPYLQRRELRRVCAAAGVHVQAYSSLGCGALLGDTTVAEVARELGRTPAQVLLRWALQNGLSVVPKSASPERVRENCEAELRRFELTSAHMQRIDSLDRGERYCWDPTTVL